MARTRRVVHAKGKRSETQGSTQNEAARAQQQLDSLTKQLHRCHTWQWEASLDPGRLADAVRHSGADVGEIVSESTAPEVEEKSVTTLRGKAVIAPALPGASFTPWFSHAATHQLVTSFAAFSQLRLRMMSGAKARSGMEKEGAELALRVRDLAARVCDAGKAHAKSTSEPSPHDGQPAAEASMPPVAEMGIRGILSFLRGAAASHPELCAEPLRLLTETLCGFNPQGLGPGSRDLADALEAVFKEVATAPADTTDPHARELAFSALVTLAVARGEADALLSTASTLLAADPRPFRPAVADGACDEQGGGAESKGDDGGDDGAAMGRDLRLTAPPPLRTLLNISHSRALATAPRLTEAAVEGTAPVPADVTADGASAIAVHGGALLVYSALTGCVYRVAPSCGNAAPYVEARAEAPRWSAPDEAARRLAVELEQGGATEASKPAPTTLSSSTGAVAACLGATLLLRCGSMEPGRFAAFDAATLEELPDVLQAASEEEQEKEGADGVGAGPCLAAPMTGRELVVVDAPGPRPSMRARRFALRGSELVPHRTALALPRVPMSAEAEIGAVEWRSSGPALVWGSPTGLDAVADSTPLHASCNDHVALAVTRSGDVLARGDVGLLSREEGGEGAGHPQRFSPLRRVSHLRVQRVALSQTGKMHHALLLLQSGRVMELGRRQWVGEEQPALREVGGPLRDGPAVVDIATRHDCSAAVTDEGRLFVWGRAAFDGIDGIRRVPEPFSTEGEVVRSVALGASHIAAVTASGRVFTAGRGEAGQCGRADAAKSHLPWGPVPGVGETAGQGVPMSVDCGSRFTVVVTDTGAALAFGSNENAQLGSVADEKGAISVTRPRQVPLPDDAFVVQASCNPQSTVLRTADNRVFVLGSAPKRARGALQGDRAAVRTVHQGSQRPLAHVCSSDSTMLALQLQQPEARSHDRMDHISLLCHRGVMCLAVADPHARPADQCSKPATLYGQMRVHSAEDGALLSAELISLPASPIGETDGGPDSPAGGGGEEKAAVGEGEAGRGAAESGGREEKAAVGEGEAGRGAAESGGREEKAAVGEGEAGRGAVESGGREEKAAVEEGEAGRGAAESGGREEKAADQASGADSDSVAQEREWRARDKRVSKALEVAATQWGTALLPHPPAEFARRLEKEEPLYRARLSANVGKGVRLRKERDASSQKSWCGSWMRGVELDVVEERGAWVRISLADRFKVMKTRKATVHEDTWCLREIKKEGETLSLIDTFFHYGPRPVGGGGNRDEAGAGTEAALSPPGPVANDAGAFRIAMDPATGAVSVLARGSALLTLHRPPRPAMDRQAWESGRERVLGATECVREGMLLLGGERAKSLSAHATRSGTPYIQELVEAAEEGTPLSLSQTAVALLSCLGDAAVRRCGGQSVRKAVAPGSLVERSAAVLPRHTLRRHRRLTSLEGWHCGQGQLDALSVTVDHAVVLHGFHASLGSEPCSGLFKVLDKEGELGSVSFHGPSATSKEDALMPVLLDSPVPLQADQRYTLSLEYTLGSKVISGEQATDEQTVHGVMWRFMSSPLDNNGTSPQRGQFVELIFSLPSPSAPSSSAQEEEQERSLEFTVLSLPKLGLQRLVNGSAAFPKALALLARGARHLGSLSSDVHCAAAAESVCSCMRMIRAQRRVLAPPAHLSLLDDDPPGSRDGPEADSEESEESEGEGEAGWGDAAARSPEDAAVAHATLLWETHDALCAVLGAVRGQLPHAATDSAAADALKQAGAEALALYHHLWPRMFSTWSLRAALLRSLTGVVKCSAVDEDAPSMDLGVRKALLLVALSVLTQLRGASRLVLPDLRRQAQEDARLGADTGTDDSAAVSAGAGAGAGAEASTPDAAGKRGHASRSDDAFSETMLQFMERAGLAPSSGNAAREGVGGTPSVVSALVEFALHHPRPSDGAEEEAPLAAAASALLATVTSEVMDSCQDAAAEARTATAGHAGTLAGPRHSVARFGARGPRSLPCTGDRDAVVLQVDHPVLLLGVELYGGDGDNSAVVEVLEGREVADEEAGPPVATGEGAFATSGGRDHGVLYFDRPARLKPRTSYVLCARVWGGARHGGRDHSDPVGVDGTRFTFTDGGGRGQFPALLYKQAKAQGGEESRPKPVRAASAGAGREDTWVWNKHDCGAMVTIGQGGMQMARNVAGSGTNGARGTRAMVEGEYEWVVRLGTSAGSHTMVGMARPQTPSMADGFTELFGRAKGEAALKNDGALWQDGRRVSSCRWNWKAGSSVRVRYDADRGALTFWDHESGEQLMSTKMEPHAEVYPAVSTTFGTGRMTLLERRVLRGGRSTGRAGRPSETTRSVLRAAKDGQAGRRDMLRLGGLAEEGERQRLAAYGPMLSLFDLILSRAEEALDGLQAPSVGAAGAVESEGKTPAAHRLLTQIVPLALLRLGQLAPKAPQVVRALESRLRSLLERTNRVEGGTAGAGDSSAGPAYFRRVVETPHPYPPALVQSWSLRFPAAVKWLVVWVDRESATAQPEDGVQFFADARCEHPVTQRFFGQRQGDGADEKHADWPSGPLLVPGNELHINFAAASAYVKDPQLSRHGFRCIVTGHALPSAQEAPVSHLRRELTFLLALLASQSALSKEPASERAATAQALASPLLRLQPFSRGLDPGTAGAALPTALDPRFAEAEKAVDAAGGGGAHRLRRAVRAMTGARAFVSAGASRSQRDFLRDFVDMRPGSLGALLAGWLQQEEEAGGERVMSALEEARRSAQVETQEKRMREEQRALEAKARSYADMYKLWKEQVSLIRGVVPHCSLPSILRALDATRRDGAVDANRAAEQLMAPGEEKDSVEGVIAEQSLIAELEREVDVLEGTLDAAKLRELREEAMAKRVAEVRRELSLGSAVAGDDEASATGASSGTGDDGTTDGKQSKEQSRMQDAVDNPVFGSSGVSAGPQGGGFSFGGGGAPSPPGPKKGAFSFGGGRAPSPPGPKGGGFVFGGAQSPPSPKLGAQNPAGPKGGGFVFGGGAPSPPGPQGGGFRFDGRPLSPPDSQGGGLRFGGASSKPAPASNGSVFSRAKEGDPQPGFSVGYNAGNAKVQGGLSKGGRGKAAGFGRNSGGDAGAGVDAAGKGEAGDLALEAALPEVSKAARRKAIPLSANLLPKYFYGPGRNRAVRLSFAALLWQSQTVPAAAAAARAWAAGLRIQPPNTESAAEEAGGKSDEVQAAEDAPPVDPKDLDGTVDAAFLRVSPAERQRGHAALVSVRGLFFHLAREVRFAMVQSSQAAEGGEKSGGGKLKRPGSFDADTPPQFMAPGDEPPAVPNLRQVASAPQVWSASQGVEAKENKVSGGVSSAMLTHRGDEASRVYGGGYSRLGSGHRVAAFSVKAGRRGAGSGQLRVGWAAGAHCADEDLDDCAAAVASDGTVTVFGEQVGRMDCALEERQCVTCAWAPGQDVVLFSTPGSRTVRARLPLRLATVIPLLELPPSSEVHVFAGSTGPGVGPVIEAADLTSGPVVDLVAADGVDTEDDLIDGVVGRAELLLAARPAYPGSLRAARDRNVDRGAAPEQAGGGDGVGPAEAERRGGTAQGEGEDEESDEEDEEDEEEEDEAGGEDAGGDGQSRLSPSLPTSTPPLSRQPSLQEQEDEVEARRLAEAEKRSTHGPEVGVDGRGASAAAATEGGAAGAGAGSGRKVGARHGQPLYALDSESVTSRLERVEGSKAHRSVLSALVSVVPRDVVEEGLEARTLLAEQRARGLRELSRMLSVVPLEGPREDVLWFCATVLHQYFPGMDERADKAAGKGGTTPWRKELRGASRDAIQAVLSALYELLGAVLHHLQSPLAAGQGGEAGGGGEAAGVVIAGAGAGTGSADCGGARVHPSVVAMRQLHALQCWSLSFPRRDDGFLHRSGLFLVLKELMGGVSNAAPSVAEDHTAEWGSDDQHGVAPTEVLRDATADLESVKPGSSEQRGSLLVDGTTSTFWQSDGGRVRNAGEARKKRMVELVRKADAAPFHAIGVCLDGGRDRESVVNGVALVQWDACGTEREVDSVKVPEHFTGWLLLLVPEAERHRSRVMVELRGPAGAPVRVRAIRPLRWEQVQEVATDGSGPPSPSAAKRAGAAESLASTASPGEAAAAVDEAAVWRRVVEAEALRLFRSLASRAFEGLIHAQGEGRSAGAEAGAGAGAGAGDGAPPKAPERPPALHTRGSSESAGSAGRARMQRQLSRQQSRELEELTTLLFGTEGSKLSSLQEHLFDLMAEELASEAREFETLAEQDPTVAGVETQGAAPEEEEDVEASEDLEREDAYCFELLVLLESLGAAGSGLAYVCQPLVLQTLFSLLRHGTARVQRAAFAVLRRALPHLSLRGLDDVLGRPDVSVRPLRKLRTEAIKRAERERSGAEEGGGPGPSLPYNGDIMAAMRAQDRAAIRVIMMARNGGGDGGPAGDGGSGGQGDTEPADKAGRVPPSGEKPPRAPALAREASTASASERDGGGKEGRAVVALLLLHCAKGLEATLRSRGRGARSGPRVSSLANDSPVLGGRLHPTVTRQLVALLRGLRDPSSPQFHAGWADAIDRVCKDAVLGLPLELGEEATTAHVESSVALWVALAALWVAGENHGDVFAETEDDVASKTGTTEVGRPVFCDNHEDGETLASRRCTDCTGAPNLCDECFDVLHLPKRMRSHQGVVLSTGAGEAFHFDFADGAGRARLDWLTLVVDTGVGKAIVEMRSRGRASGAKGSVCRFCEQELTAENRCTQHCHLPGLQDVCTDDGCVEAAAQCCGKVLTCGHPCLGVRGEDACLPCMHGCACGEGAAAKYDKEGHCRVCLDQLGSGPVVELACGHVFHFGCANRLLEGQWDGPRITFGFMKCPLCSKTIEHPHLASLVEPFQKLESEVERKAMMRAQYEGSDKSPDVTEPGGRFYGDLAGYAMDRYAYFMCSKCGKPYFGGERACGAAVDVAFDPSELVCGSCSPAAAGVRDCPVHGMDYIEWKCRFCCSVATYFCFGTTHFCSVCHTEPGRMTSSEKESLPQCPCGPLGKQRQGSCPLGVEHPPTGEEYCLGCGLCRNAQTF